MAWQIIIFPYIQESATDSIAWGTYLPAFTCPSADWFGYLGVEFGFFYAMPKRLSTNTLQTSDPTDYYSPQWRRVSDLRKPGVTPLAFDYYQNRPVADWWVDPPGSVPGDLMTEDSNRRVVRHGRGADTGIQYNYEAQGVDNFLFVDGHVDQLRNHEENDPEYEDFF